MVGHVDPVCCVRRTRHRNEPNPAPPIPCFGKQPGVSRVACGVEHRATDDPVVDVIPARPTPRIAVVDPEKYIWLTCSDRSGEIAAKRHTAFDQPIWMREKLDVIDPDDGAARNLLSHAKRPHFGGVHRVDAGLALGDQQITDGLALLGPSRHGAGCSVLHVVGMGDDRQRRRPIFRNVLELIVHGQTLRVESFHFIQE